MATDNATGIFSSLSQLYAYYRKLSFNGDVLGAKMEKKKLIFQRRKKLFAGGATRLATTSWQLKHPKENNHQTANPTQPFLKPVTPDDKLAAVVGAKPLPRTEIVSKLWVYIKKNGLQDKKVRTQINADDTLKAIFDGKKSVTMFEMNKYVSGHLKA